VTSILKVECDRDTFKIGELSFAFSPEVSLALAVWKRPLIDLTGIADSRIEYAPGYSPSFHLDVAIFLAKMLDTFQDRLPKSHDDIKGQVHAIEKGDYPDDRKHGYGLAQLASYAQRAWVGEFISCPLEQRLDSLYLAALRMIDGCPPSNAAKDATQERRKRIEVLFRYILRVLHPSLSMDSPSKDDPENLKLNNVLVTSTTPACPFLVNVFRGATFQGQFWIESLVERLKHDHDAYERDVLRAKREYAVLRGKNNHDRPVEMIRISEPESLLFDLWAWQDGKNSRQKEGFPLVWIDNGWGYKGFELRLKRSLKDAPLSLFEQPGFAELRTHTEDCGWALRFSDQFKVADVRWLLKKNLFPDGADIRLIDIECIARKETDGSAPLPPREEIVPLRLAIDDSDLDIPASIPDKFPLKKLNHYRWASVEYSDSVDIYKTWAGDEIASILYSVLRPEQSMRLPNSFLEEHVFRQTNLVSVWSREGLAVAVKSGDIEAEKVADNLKEKLAKAAELEGTLRDLIDNDLLGTTAPDANREQVPPQGSDRPQTVLNVNRLHLKLRHEIAHPDFRSIRLFMDKLHAQDVYNTFRQSEAETRQQKTLDEQLAMGKKLDWLELFIFVFYITEASHILGDFFTTPIIRLVSIIGFAAASLIFAYIFLNIANDDERKKAQPSSAVNRFRLRDRWQLIVCSILAASFASAASWKFQSGYVLLLAWLVAMLAATWIPFSFFNNGLRFWKGLRFWLRLREDWEQLGRLGLLSTVVVLYTGHLVTGVQNSRPPGQLRDSEAVLQSIEQSLKSLASGKQPGNDQIPSAETQQIEEITRILKSVDSHFKTLEAQKQPTVVPRLAAKPSTGRK